MNQKCFFSGSDVTDIHGSLDIEFCDDYDNFFSLKKVNIKKYTIWFSKKDFEPHNVYFAWQILCQRGGGNPLNRS